MNLNAEVNSERIRTSRIKPFLLVRIITNILAIYFSVNSLWAQEGPVDSLLYRLGEADDDTTKANILGDLGEVYFSQMKYDLAIQQYRKLDSVYSTLMGSGEEKEHLRKRAICNYKIGKGYYLRGEYDSAILNYKVALNGLEAAGDKNLYGKVLNNIGACFQIKGNYIEALSYYHKGLQIAHDLTDSVLSFHYYTNIGVINNELENYDQALKYLNWALEISQNRKDVNGSAAVYGNMGVVYANKESYDSAYEHHLKTVSIYKESGNTHELGKAYANLADIHMLKGEYELAMKRSSEAVLIFENTNNIMGLTYIFNIMADILNRTGDYKKSIEYSKKSISMAKKAGLLYVEKVGYSILSESYEKLGIFSKALACYKLYVERKDSIFNLEKHQHFAEMQTLYETEKAEQLRSLAEKESEIFKLKYSKQRNFTVYSVSGLTIITLFLVLVYIQKLQLKRANRMLVRKNMEVVASEREQRDQRSELEMTLQYLKDKGIEPIKSTVTEKYSRSKLTDDETNEIIDRIEHLMKYDKLYLDCSLTLDKLSKMLNTNRSYISQIINDRYNENFNNFLNKYRVKEACHLLEDPKNNILTIEGIALKVGFSSVTTFNRSFKKYTGVTASLYIKNQYN